MRLGNSPVFIFGAGATKACGGPLTAEILPWAFDRPLSPGPGGRHATALEQVNQCLVQHFHVPPVVTDRKKEDYPPLPLVLSLLDLAIERDRPLVFGADRQGAEPEFWDRQRLEGARAAIEILITAVLNKNLRKVTPACYVELFETVRNSCESPEPRAISLNYDTLLDNVLFDVAEHKSGVAGRPDYACDIQTPAYRSWPTKYGQLFKLHGSLNWLYCACCRQLEIRPSDCGRNGVRSTLLDALERDSQTRFERPEAPGAAFCPECETRLRAVMITPTRAKDYRSPHLQAVWYEAERTLRQADHACFIGYSLPDEDIEVIDLLRRGLGHLDGNAVTVVEHDCEKRSIGEHPVGRRYRSIFGADIDWHTEGFEGWLQQASGAAA